MKRLICAAVFGMAASAVSAEEPITVPFDGDFEEAAFAVEAAIIGKGLKIDYVSHVGEMLNRTGADVGSDVKIFDNAEIYIFCSATISREVMEADPMNITHCPYGIFIADQGGEVVVGHRSYPAGEMQKVQALLTSIVEEATEN